MESNLAEVDRRRARAVLLVNARARRDPRESCRRADEEEGRESWESRRSRRGPIDTPRARRPAGDEAGPAVRRRFLLLSGRRQAGGLHARPAAAALREW